MELSEFLQIFYNVYRCGTSSRSQFVDCILSAGLVSDAKKDELSGISRKQKEEIFSGMAKPYFFCKRFADDFGVDVFKDWLDEIGEGEEDCIHDDLMDKLCAGFQPYVQEITSGNCSKVLSKVLFSILDENAKKAIQSSNKIEQGKRRSVHNKQNGRCYLCQRPVSIERNKDDSMSLFEFEENGSKKTVGLCSSCFKTSKKKGGPLPICGKPRFEFSDEMIEEELAEALEQLEKLDEEELEPQLNYAGLKISKKIDKKKYPAFCHKVSDNVARYYPMMQKMFSDYDGENGNSFQRFSYKMRGLFLQIKNQADNPSFVFDAIVDEVERKANTDRLVSELIVSFFIQNCEVFDEISE